MTIKSIAFNLYKPPFRYQYGYIYDSEGNVFADNGGGDDDQIESENSGNLALRVRGWGRIQYLKTEFNNGDIQDVVGELIVDALNCYWGGSKCNSNIDFELDHF